MMISKRVNANAPTLERSPISISICQITSSLNKKVQEEVICQNRSEWLFSRETFHLGSSSCLKTPFLGGRVNGLGYDTFLSSGQELLQVLLSVSWSVDMSSTRNHRWIHLCLSSTTKIAHKIFRPTFFSSNNFFNQNFF